MRTRRARKSFEQWSELVEQFDCSNDSMERFCEQQDLALSTFQRWRSTIHKSKALGTSKSNKDASLMRNFKVGVPVISSPEWLYKDAVFEELGSGQPLSLIHI